MNAHCAAVIKARSRRQEKVRAFQLLPLRIYISTQTGREYVLGYDYKAAKLCFFRLDHIIAVKKGRQDEAWSHIGSLLCCGSKHRIECA